MRQEEYSGADRTLEQMNESGEISATVFIMDITSAIFLFI